MDAKKELFNYSLTFIKCTHLVQGHGTHLLLELGKLRRELIKKDIVKFEDTISVVEDLLAEIGKKLK